MMKEKGLEYGRIDSIFDREIKGKVDAPWRYDRQLWRCNTLMSGPDVESFEASVRTLLGDLPIKIKNTVKGRTSEYNKTALPTYEYQTTCGHNIGTPDNPFISVKDHPEWEFLLDVPRPFCEEHGDMISIISPKEIPGELFTDYEELLSIIKEEGDRGGIGWKYQRASKEMGPIEKILPGKLASEIEDVLTELMINHRRQGHMYSWAEMLRSQLSRTPRTPTPPRDPPKEEEVSG